MDVLGIGPPSSRPKTHAGEPTPQEREWLERRRVAVFKDRDGWAIPNGAILAQMFGELRQQHGFLFGSKLFDDLDRLQGLCAQFAYERTPEKQAKSRNLMAGKLLAHPEHSAFVGAVQLGDDLRWPAAALLRWMISPSLDTRVLDDTKRRRRISRFLLVTNPGQRTAAVDDAVAVLGARLRMVSSGQPVLAENDPFAELKGAKDLRRDLNEIYRGLLDALRAAVPRPDSSIETPALSTLGPDADLAKMGLPLSDLVGTKTYIERRVSENVSARAERKGGKRQRAIEDHFLFLGGALCPGHDRLLLDIEASECLRVLFQRALGAVERDPSFGLAIASVAMSALTTRHPQLCRRAILAWLYGPCSDRPNPTDPFAIYGEYWISSVPDSEKFKKLAPIKLEPIAETVTATVRLPWPREMAQMLEALRKSKKALLSSATDDEALDGVYKDLKARVTPRVTIEHLRRSLPVAIFQAGRALHYSQLIAGDSLTHSTAPLHYYGISPQQIREVYARGLKAMFGIEMGDLSVVPSGADDGLVGAPVAGIRRAVVRVAVGKLLAQTRRSMHSSDPIEAFNALSVYGTCMFVAGTAHRQTRRFEEITARSIEEVLGFAVFGDKILDPSDAARLVKLADVVRRQALEQRRAAVALSAVLRETDGKLAAAFGDLANGEAPLFAVVDSKSGKLRPIQRADLAAYWVDLPFETPLLRAFLATQLLSRGADPSDIYRQLGHSLEVGLLSTTDPVNPIEWGRRLAPHLDKVMEDAGWRVVKANHPEIQLTSMPSLSADAISKEDESFRKRHSRDRRRPKRSNLERKAYAATVNAAIDVLLRVPVPSYSQTTPPKGVKLRLTELSTLQAGVVETANSAAEREEGRLILIRRLRHHRHKHGWDVRPMPSPFFRWSPEPAALTPSCLDAARWNREMLAWVLDEPAIRSHWLLTSKNQRRAIALGTTLLAIDGGVSNPEMLPQVLRGLPDCVSYPCRSDSVLVPLPDPRSQADNEDSAGRDTPSVPVQPVASVTLTGLSALFALRFRDMVRAQRLTTQEFGAFTEDIPALLGQVLGKRLGASPTKPLELLCKMAALGRRLSYSGLLCALQDGRVPARDLPPQRMWELATGSAAAKMPSVPRTMASVPIFVDEMAVAIADLEQVAKKVSDDSRSAGDERLAAIQSLRDIADDEGRSSWVRGCADWLALLYAGKKPKASVIRDYFGVVVKRVLQTVGDLSLQEPDADSLSTILEKLAVDVPTDTEVQRYRLFFRMVSHCEDYGYGWEMPDSEPPTSESWWDVRPSVRPYLTGPHEARRGRDLLLLAMRASKNAALFSSDANQQSALAGALASATGGRTSEVTGLEVGDVYTVAGQLLVWIRGNTTRSLKTEGSARPIVLEGVLDASSQEALLKGQDLARNLHPGHASHARLFFPYDLRSAKWSTKESIKKGGLWIQRLPTRFTRAVSLTGGPDPARFYAARHAMGCRCVLAALVPQSKVFGWPAFKDLGLPRELDGLQGPLRLLRASRILGHALAETTLIHYFHFTGEILLREITFQNEKPGVEAVARVRGITTQGLRNRISGKAEAAEALDYMLQLSTAQTTVAELPLPVVDEDLAGSLESNVRAGSTSLSVWVRLLREYVRFGGGILWGAFSGDTQTTRRAITAIRTVLSSGALRRTGPEITVTLPTAKGQQVDFRKAYPELDVPLPRFSAVCAMARRFEDFNRRRPGEARDLLDLLDRMCRTRTHEIVTFDAHEATTAESALAYIAKDLFTVETKATSRCQIVRLVRGAGREVARAELRFFAVAVVTAWKIGLLKVVIS